MKEIRIAALCDVRLDGNELERDDDYTLSWMNNVNVGTATVVVTGWACKHQELEH